MSGEKEVFCPCGTLMDRTTPGTLYGSQYKAKCDNCEEITGTNKDMYHCPNGECDEHEKGYIFCLLSR